MKSTRLKLRLASAALGCVMLISPLAAQAASPVPMMPGTEPELCEEENDTIGMRLNCSSVTLRITSNDPYPMTGLYVEKARTTPYYYESWSSSSPSVAMVDDYGIVTAYKAGSTVITCRTEYGEYATCRVTVTKEEDRPALNESNFTLTMKYNDLNPTKQLYLTRGNGYLYGWSSSNSAVASVNSNGLVTAIAPGSATITALCNGRPVSCNVNVSSDIGKLKLSKDTMLLKAIGGAEGLGAVVDGSGVAASWTSSNPAVASVDANGVVTALADGEAVITAVAPNGSTASCTVYVGTAATDYEDSEAMAAAVALAGLTAIVGLSVAAAAD